jgi:hypothetical protein
MEALKSSELGTAVVLSLPAEYGGSSSKPCWDWLCIPKAQYTIFFTFSPQTQYLHYLCILLCSFFLEFILYKLLFIKATPTFQ